MTDLERLGLSLVGFAVAVIASGVLLGLIGAWINKRRNGVTGKGFARADRTESPGVAKPLLRAHRNPPRFQDSIAEAEAVAKDIFCDAVTETQ